MPAQYVSDDKVTINTQGLRTVLREDEPQWMLRWSYKGEFGVHRYLDQAARDAMYDKLRQALTESKQPRWYDAACTAASRAEISLDSFLQDAIEEHLRRSDGGRRWPIAESKQQKQAGGYRKIDAIKLVRETGTAWGFDIGRDASRAIVEALEPIMRTGGQGDAV